MDDAFGVDRARFYMHLAMCGGCRRFFQEHRAVREAVGHVDEDQLPADFVPVMNEVL